MKADPGAIARQLQEVLAAFIGHARLEAEDPAGKHAAWAREVEKAADALAELLGRFEPGRGPEPGDGSGRWNLIRNLPLPKDRELALRRAAIQRIARDALRPGTSEAVSDWESMGLAMAGVPYIARAAALTAGHWESKKGGGGARRSSAEDFLMDGLSAIYREAFGRAPGITRADCARV
ncbi:MAG: hypothetical protein ICV73_26240 [Acetobacteraceae bacterium]|nr:hypothetical protein [Acetobacteraceae bacterium]